MDLSFFNEQNLGALIIKEAASPLGAISGAWGAFKKTKAFDVMSKGARGLERAALPAMVGASVVGLPSQARQAKQQERIALEEEKYIRSLNQQQMKVASYQIGEAVDYGMSSEGSTMENNPVIELLMKTAQDLNL